MIQILPMEEKLREQELLQSHAVKGSRVLLMEDNKGEMGWVSLKVEGESLCIIKFELIGVCDFENLDMEQSFIVDTLMRSAASYGEVHGASKICTADGLYNSFLKKKGFEIIDDKAQTPMSTIVHYE